MHSPADIDDSFPVDEVNDKNQEEGTEGNTHPSNEIFQQV